MEIRIAPAGYGRARVMVGDKVSQYITISKK